jgi:hypothetical protein
VIVISLHIESAYCAIHRCVFLADELQELREATGIEESELQRNLQSLACAKFRVLKKHPPGRDINLDDSFSFDADFTSSMLKIKISTVASKVESGDERKETKDRIDEERRHQIEVRSLISIPITESSSMFRRPVWFVS